MKKTIFISTDLLAPALRERFATMLQVAGRRSIVAWDLADRRSADVVLRTEQGADDLDSVPIYVTDTPLSGDANLLRMPSDFRVTTLMDVLDLAAVRVMNKREQTARVAVDVPTPANTVYKLKHWVFLGASRSGIQYARVLAAMSRDGVTRQWMTGPGGLSHDQVDAFLAELQLRGALLSQAPASQPVQRISPPAAARGFVSRLKSWITGSRTQFAHSGAR